MGLIVRLVKLIGFQNYLNKSSKIPQSQAGCYWSSKTRQEQRNTIDRSVCFNFSMTSFIFNQFKWKSNCPRLHAAIIPVQSQSHV
jgi:hypothetical protein